VEMFACCLSVMVGNDVSTQHGNGLINSKLREKQASLYDRWPVIQEARDRIQPATQNIVAPDDLPDEVLRPK